MASRDDSHLGAAGGREGRRADLNRPPLATMIHTAFGLSFRVAPQFGDGERRLYNITEDPGETRDLFQERAGLLEELKAA